MPKKPIDFSKGLIYTITTDDGSTYVGSTTNFIQRKYCHKSSMSNENNRAYNFKLYKAMRASSSYEIKPYKLFPCNSNLELTIEEERVRRDLTAKLNMKACYDDGALKKEQDRKYRETHKAEIAEYKKAYHEANKAEVAEKKKAHYETNKAEILEKRKEKHTCEICGSIYRKAHKSRHMRSKKCQGALAESQSQ